MSSHSSDLYDFPDLRRLAGSSTNVYGSARWMNQDDFARLSLNYQKGVVLGQTAEGERLYSSDGHLVIFAPSRAGKGIGFVQTNLADYAGSMVVLDPKGENAIVSAELRRANGHEVIILDPFGKTRMKGNSHNPLSALAYADDHELGPCIEALSDALVIEPPDNKDPYWTDGAKRFCSFLMWFMVARLPAEKRNLITMYELAHSGHANLSRIAQAMKRDSLPHPELERMCHSLGNWYLDRNPKEMSTFDSVVTNNFGWIGDFIWAKSLGGPPSPPLPLKRKGKPITVYLVLPFKHMKRYQRWLRLMVADCLSSLFDTDGAPDVPVLFLMDEAYKGLGKMEALFDAYATVASSGGRLCFVYQDVPQIQKNYPGSAWESIVANSKVVLFFSVNDTVAAEYITKRCGHRTTSVPGNSTGVQEPLIRLEEVLGLPKDEILAFVQNEPPARFKRLNVLNDPRYKDRLARNWTYDEPEEKEYVARTDFVPINLEEGSSDQAGGLGFLRDRETEELSEEFGRKVVKDAQGNFGYLDERGIYVPLND